jgi:cytochrome c biogenesis protein CcmG, thiol:disulfide interchange protein DsbE
VAITLESVRRVLIPLLAAVFGVALISLLAFGLASRGASRSLDDRVARAERPPAPVQALPSLRSGARTSLADYRGRIVLLNFWASWCVPCQTEAPMLERTQRQLERHAGTVLGVTYLDTSPDSQTFVRRYGLSFPQLRDVSGGFAHAYGTDQLPESFVIDRHGGVVAISRGEVNQAFLDRALSLAART